MRSLALLGMLALCVAVAGGIYFFGGFYSVSAANGGNTALEWAVRKVRMASVAQHGSAPAPPVWFDDSETVQAGAREFAEEGCVHCHGAPGTKPSPMVRGMRPQPPELARAAQRLSNDELFWVVKNGIRMTGMPAFGGMDNTEIWRVVAFVNRMSSITPMQYERWSAAAGGHAEVGETHGHGSAESGKQADRH